MVDSATDPASSLSETAFCTADIEQPPPEPGSTSASWPLLAFLPDEIVADRFRITRFLGHGGMGQVFAAEDLDLGGAIALKVIHPAIARDERAIRRFKREVQLARQVTHPNVCRIFDLFAHRAGTHAEWGRAGKVTLVLTMELLVGETLSRRLTRGSLTPEEALPLIGQITEALDAAHRARIVHRDLKSGNVILVSSDVMLATDGRQPRATSGGSQTRATSGGSQIRVVVTDFGLAVSAGAESRSLAPTVRSASFVGTRAYAAPELLKGAEPTVAADIYALGVVIHEMITGVVPLASGQDQKKLRLAPDPGSNPPPAPRSGLDPVWECVVSRCLDHDPQGRFASAPEVFAALTQSDAPVRVSSTSPRQDEPGTPDLSEPGLRAPRREPTGAIAPSIGHRVARALVVPGFLLVLGLVWFSSSPRPTAERSDAGQDAIDSMDAIASFRAPVTAEQLTRQGRFYWWQWTPAGRDKSLSYFEAAVAEDPTYAPAYAGLADAYVHKSPPEKSLPKAREALRRSFELDPNLAEAYATQGLIALNADWDGPAAEAAYQEAIRRAPGYAPAHLWYAELLSFQGRHEEALVEAETASRLQPEHYLVRGIRGQRLHAAGRYTEALEQFRQALASSSNVGWLHMARAESLFALGQNAEAIAANLEAVAIDDAGNLAAYRQAAETEDIRAFWCTNRANLEHYAKKHWLSAVVLARAYAGCGQIPEALAFLEKARNERAELLLLNRRSSAFASLAEHPRFIALMAEIDSRLHLSQQAE